MDQIKPLFTAAAAAIGGRNAHTGQATAENGMLESGELEDKSPRLTPSALGEPGAAALFERLQRLEDEKNLDWLGAQP